jgi:cyclomaltodextrinase
LKFGIDGWRLDVPGEVKTPGFWQDFRQRVKAINPDAYIVGEIWGDSRQWLDGTQFDGVMNYLFTGPAIAFTAGDRVVHELVENKEYQPYPALSAEGYASKIAKLLALYPWEIQLTQMNLLASHDTARLMSIVNGDQASVELATLLLFTFPGAPNIFYGDEVGLAGGLDPDCRRGFPQEADWNQELLQIHKQLIAIRNNYKALRIGEYKQLHAQGMLYVMARIWEREELIIAVNAGDTSETALIDASFLQTQPSQVLYGKAYVEWNQGKLSLHLPPRSGCVLSIN